MNIQDFKDAAALAKEQSPAAYNFIYTYRDVQLNKFHPPFVNDKEPSFMVDGLKTACIKGTEEIKKMVGLEFCLVGSFELNTGKMDVFEEPQILVNIDEFLAKFGGSQDGKVC